MFDVNTTEVIKTQMKTIGTVIVALNPKKTIFVFGQN